MSKQVLLQQGSYDWAGLRDRILYEWVLLAKQPFSSYVLGQSGMTTVVCIFLLQGYALKN